MKEMAQTFRRFAAQTKDKAYIQKLLKAAVDLEDAARQAEPEQDEPERTKPIARLEPRRSRP